MNPGHKRQIIVARVNRGRCPAREACRPFCLPRRTFGYEAKQPDAWMAKLKAALRRMSREHPELGDMKIARLLKKAGWRVGSRLIPRRCQQLALMVPVKQPKRRRGGISTGLATKATHPTFGSRSVSEWGSPRLSVNMFPASDLLNRTKRGA